MNKLFLLSSVVVVVVVYFCKHNDSISSCFAFNN